MYCMVGIFVYYVLPLCMKNMCENIYVNRSFLFKFKHAKCSLSQRLSWVWIKKLCWYIIAIPNRMKYFFSSKLFHVRNPSSTYHFVLKVFCFSKIHTTYLPNLLLLLISWIKIDKSETPMLCYPSLIVNVGVKKSLWFLSAFRVKSNDIIIGPKFPLRFLSDDEFYSNHGSNYIM